MESIHIPAIRKRFVRRAKYLKDHQPFLDDLDRFVKSWNQEFPTYPILQRVGRPPARSMPHSAELLPPALRRAVNAKEESTYFDRIEATRAWNQGVLEICSTWWPGEYYPHHHFNDHPAGDFVSACVLGNPNLIREEERIRRWGIGVGTLAYDPFDPEGSPEVRQLRWMWNTFMERVSEMFDENGMVSRDQLERLSLQVITESTPAHQDREAPQYVFIPVYPGFSPTTDGKAALSAIGKMLEYAHASENLDEKIRELARAGKSQNAIADLVGLTQQRVGQILRQS